MSLIGCEITFTTETIGSVFSTVTTDVFKRLFNGKLLSG